VKIRLKTLNHVLLIGCTVSPVVLLNTLVLHALVVYLVER